MRISVMVEVRGTDEGKGTVDVGTTVTGDGGGDGVIEGGGVGEGNIVGEGVGVIFVGVEVDNVITLVGVGTIVGAVGGGSIIRNPRKAAKPKQTNVANAYKPIVKLEGEVGGGCGERIITPLVAQ